MAVHGSGGAAARLCESFQQTGDKDTRGRRVFGRVKNISYFWIMLKPCGRSRSQRHRNPLSSGRSCKDTMSFRAQAKQSPIFLG